MLTLGGVQDLFATSFQNELFERGDQLLTQCLYCTGLIFHVLLLRTLKKKKTVLLGKIALILDLGHKIFKVNIK